jgi:hypothetical protein
MLVRSPLRVVVQTRFPMVRVIMLVRSALRWLVRSRLRVLVHGAGMLAIGALICAPAGCAFAPTVFATAPTHDAIAPTSHAIAPTSVAIAPSPDVIAPSPDAQAAPQPAPPAFDAARAWAHLQKQVAFGPRPSGSAALQACRNYIIAELKKVGLDARRQTFTAKTPAGDIPMVNLSATIPGRRPERIIFASHYDTKRATDFTFVGASDGASSTAALLELGRALKSRQNEFTIELLFLDGEEAVNWEWRDPDNTYGSRFYVETARKANALGSIKALVLLDMIGDRNLTIRRDATSTPWLVDAIWDTAGRIGHRRTFSNELTAIEDDHMHFITAGVPAVDIIDLDYPQWHTAEDDLAHVSQQSLKIVGDVVLASLPAIEQRLAR